MNSDKLENFIQAFREPTSGCVRDCACGKTYYHDDDIYTWEEGELERLRDSPKAIALDYPVGIIEVKGRECVVDCVCWHKDAEQNMRALDRHAHQIAAYFTLEKARLFRLAENAPVVIEPKLKG